MSDFPTPTSVKHTWMTKLTSGESFLLNEIKLRLEESGELTIVVSKYNNLEIECVKDYLRNRQWIVTDDLAKLRNGGYISPRKLTICMSKNEVK